MRPGVERAVAAASFANLCMMYEWTGLLTFTDANSYLMNVPPSKGHYAAGLVSMAILSAIAAGWMWGAERAGAGRWARPAKWCLLVALLMPANALRDVVAISHPMLKGELLRFASPDKVLSLVAAFALGWMCLSWRFGAKMYEAARFGLLLLSPAVLVTTAQAVSRVITPPVIERGAATAALQASADGQPRVVWVVFDELDEGLLFEYRPAGLELPEFDRLRKASVMATRAKSPSRSTLSAIPSLLMGRQVKGARERAASQLLIKAEAEPELRPFRREEAIFHTARSEGYNAAAAGWYHPYCRLFGADLVECAQEGMQYRLASMGSGFGEIVGNQLRMLFETSLLSPFGQSVVTKSGVKSYERLESAVLRMAANAKLQLVFVHLQPPHAPHFYDRQRGDYSLANSPVSGYLGGVALADKALGRIRRTIEDAGLAERTHVIVTSDHVYRSSKALVGRDGKYVPFLVHVAGQSTGREAGAEWRTVGARGLVLKLLRGEVSKPEEVVVELGGGER